MKITGVTPNAYIACCKSPSIRPPKNEAKKAAKELEIAQAYQDYIELAGCYLERTQTSSEALKNDYKIPEIGLGDLNTFCQHAERQIDQIRRRAIQGETIPHAEKVFSLFQPLTEWISKGKAGVPVELGLRVCIMEDSHGFILHSLICQKTTDDNVTVPMVEATKAPFPSFNACSFDKGFHSPDNQKELKSHIDQVGLPKKASYPKPIRNANTHRSLCTRKSNIPPLNRLLTPWKSMGWINTLLEKF